MNVDIGFSGTQSGMTVNQTETFRRWIALFPHGSFHHGDCVGSDAEADVIARSYHRPIVVHPPEVKYKRAFVQNAHLVLVPKPYLIRNHDIVDATDVLFAAPGGFREKMRSGTWATIRYARKVQKPILICWPDGGWATEYRGVSYDINPFISLFLEKMNTA